MKKVDDKIFRTEIDGQNVCISLIEKENEFGLYYNDRVFVLVEGHYFGYITKFKETDEPKNIDLAKLKINVPLNDLRTVSSNGNIIKIRFQVTQQGKKVDKIWNIRTKTRQLALQWVSKLDEQKKKSLSKEVQHKSPLPISQTKRSQLVSNVVNQQFAMKKQLQKHQIINRSNMKSQGIQHNSQEVKLQKSILNPLYEGSNQSNSQQSFYGKKSGKNESNNQIQQKGNSANLIPINLIQMARKSNPKSQSNQTKKKSTNYYEMVSKIVSQGQQNTQLSHSHQPIHHFPKVSELQEIHEEEFIKEKDKIGGKSIGSNLGSNLGSNQGSNLGINMKSSKQINIKSSKNINKQPWTYQYLTYPHSQVFQSFGDYCFQILSLIIDDLGFEQRKRKYHPKYKSKSYWIYEIEDIQMKLTFISLKETNFGNNQNGALKICDVSEVKNIMLEFKNFNYLYKIIQNQGKLRVPLTAICQYKCFSAYFKVNSEFDYNNGGWGALTPDLERISKNSKISIDTLKNQQKILILPLRTNFYTQIHNGKYQVNNFEYYFIQELQSFIPSDQVPTQTQPWHRLRPEIFENQSEIDSIAGFYNLSNVKNLQVQQYHKLNYFSQKIYTSIQNAVSQLDKLQFYPLNSAQLSNYLHRHGINMRYIGQIYSNLTLQFTKRIIGAQIMARVCKILLKKTIQDVHLNAACTTTEQIQDFNNSTCSNVLDFLNCVIGTTYDTADMWKVLNIHTDEYYRLNISPQEIDKAYFLLALLDQCLVKVKWNEVYFEGIFENNNLLNQENTHGIGKKIKIYKPIFEQKYKKVMVLMRQETDQNFERCVKELSLDSNSIPQIFQINDQIYNLKRFLASFVHPQTSMSTRLKFAHLKLYETQQKPFRPQMQIILTEIKWYMRERKKQKYVKGCQKFIRKVNHFYGDFHPLLIELYDLFSFYHLNQGDYEDSTTFAKSSLVTVLKICGTTHLKTAQAYYQLSQCYLKANKKDDALNHLQKAKSILQANGKGQSVPFAIILGKLSLLNLNQNNYAQSIKLALSCVGLLDQNKSHRQDQRTQAYEILARCYQLLKNKDQQLKLSNYCVNKLIDIRTPLNLERLLKICLYPIFSTASQNDCSLYLDILSQIPLQINTSSYGKSYELLKARIKQNSLITNVRSYLQNMVEIEKYVRQKGILKKWKNLQNLYQRETVNDCLALTQELLYFLGEGFITGSLRQAL